MLDAFLLLLLALLAADILQYLYPRVCVCYISHASTFLPGRCVVFACWIRVNIIEFSYFIDFMRNRILRVSYVVLLYVQNSTILIYIRWGIVYIYVWLYLLYFFPFIYLYTYITRTHETDIREVGSSSLERRPCVCVYAYLCDARRKKSSIHQKNMLLLLLFYFVAQFNIYNDDAAVDDEKRCIHTLLILKRHVYNVIFCIFKST